MVIYDLFSIFSPLSLAVYNASVSFRNCSLEVEAGRENIFNTFTQCFAELCLNGSGATEGDARLSLGSVSANPSVPCRAPLQPFEGMNFYQES